MPWWMSGDVLWIGFWIVLSIGVAVFGFFSTQHGKRREAFIRSYEWPPGLLDRFAEKQPTLSSSQQEQVAQALRQFFLVHLRSGSDSLAMPSRAVDDLWHEFILYTREYGAFCKRAFGKFLHHLPASVLSRERQASNAGLRRAWWWACRDEKIDPRKPERLPLLFAVDAELAIVGGYLYYANCKKRRAAGEPIHCGADFSSTDFDGTTTGFGDASSSDSSTGSSDARDYRDARDSSSIDTGSSCSSCSSCSSSSSD